MNETTRVLVVEDDDDVRESLEFVLAEAPGVSLAGSFREAAAALEALAAGLRADIALVDLGLPDMRGQDLIRRLRVLAPTLDAVVLTVHEDRDNLMDAFHAGATGYLLKDMPHEQVVAHVREAHAGGAPMSPSIARRVVAELGQAPDRNPLTPREGEVLELLTRGFSYQQTGSALGIGVGTVQGHIKAIYRKLEVSSKAEATAEAYRRGLVG